MIENHINFVKVCLILRSRKYTETLKTIIIVKIYTKVRLRHNHATYDFCLSLLV
jgi:hypothetical protein